MSIFSKKQNIHSKEELKALKSLDSENAKVVGSMDNRHSETDTNQSLVSDFRKRLKEANSEKDPKKLRALRKLK